MQSIPENESRVFREAIGVLNTAGLPYVIGGAFAVYHYAGLWRNTNDLDVYLERPYVPSAVEVLTQHGFKDIGEMAAGDRDWIFHAEKDGTMLDVIWQSPTGMPTADSMQFERSSPGEFLGMATRFMPPDDLVLSKIFTMNRDRCDWPDVIRIIHACPDDFNWEHLLNAMGEHWPVLLSFIVLFDWVYPEMAYCVPNEVRLELLRRKNEDPMPTNGPNREIMLDPWVYTRPKAT